jgi:hypothetical protein
VLILWCGLCGWIGHTIGAQKGQGGIGAALGILFGPIGLIIAALLPPAGPPRLPQQRPVQQCQTCGMLLYQEVRFCPNCGKTSCD